MNLFGTLRKEILKDQLRKSEVGNKVLNLEEEREDLLYNNPKDIGLFLGFLLFCLFHHL